MHRRFSVAAILALALAAGPALAQSAAQHSGAQQSPGGDSSGSGGARSTGAPAGPRMASPPPAGVDYGEQRILTLAGADKVLAAAKAAAQQNQAPSSIAVVDGAGDLVSFAQMDGARPAGISLAIGKARSAARFREPTQALENAINGGRSAAITAHATEMQGGVPLSSGGAIIGAVGVSGLNKDNDIKIAEAAAAALK